MTTQNQVVNYDEELSMESLRPRKEFVNHKINDGQNFFRILPAIPEMETIGQKGWPFKFYMTSWGLIDPERGTKKPVNVYVAGKKDICFEYVGLLNAKIDAEKEKLMKAVKAKNPTASDDEIKKSIYAKFKPYTDFSSAIKPQRKFFYNAIDQSGKIGLLGLPKTAHEGTQKALFDYRNETNLVPTSLRDGGVWLKITRTGKGQYDTEYDVKINQKVIKENNKTMYINDNTSLPESVIVNYYTGKLYFDLTTIYTSLTEKEIKERLLITIREASKELPFVLIPGFDDFSSLKESYVKKEVIAAEPESDIDDTSFNYSLAGDVEIEYSLEAPEEAKIEIPAPKAPSNTKSVTPKVASKPISADLMNDVDALMKSSGLNL